MLGYDDEPIYKLVTVSPGSSNEPEFSATTCALTGRMRSLDEQGYPCHQVAQVPLSSLGPLGL